MNNAEKELLELFRKGERRAYNDIFGRYYGRLCQYSFDIVKDTQDSQDVAIVVITNLFAKQPRPQFTRLYDLEGWLFLAARRDSIDVLRRRATREQRYEERASEVHINDQLDHELLERTFEYVDKLPPQTRKVIILRYQDGKKFKEIAEELNISPRTAENLVSTALHRLRSRFQNDKLLWLVPLVGLHALTAAERFASILTASVLVPITILLNFL